jgi:hypothetical protein
METQEWLEATNSTIMLWGDSDLERISLHSNIERLKVKLSNTIIVTYLIILTLYAEFIALLA